MKEKEYKKLVWKYFWEQKWKEIRFYLIALGILLSVAGVFFFLYLFQLLAERYPTITAIIFGTLTGLFIIYLLIKWINSNWQEAKRRARKKK